MLPEWTLKVLIAATFVHVAFAVICSLDVTGDAPRETDDNPFVTIKNVVFFTGCPGLNGIAAFVLFMLLSLPILLIGATFVFQMFGSEIGAAVAIILGLVTGGLLVLF